MSPSNERVNAVADAIQAEFSDHYEFCEACWSAMPTVERVTKAAIAVADATRPKLEVTEEMIDGAASAMWSVAMKLRMDAPCWEELDNKNRAWYMNMAKRMLEAVLKVTE